MSEQSSQKTKELSVAIPESKGEESKKLEKEQLDEFLTPLFKTLETPLYYRGYMNFIERVNMTLPKDIAGEPLTYGDQQPSETGVEKLELHLNKDKIFPNDLSYPQIREEEKFRELLTQSKKGFRDGNKGKDNISEEFYDFYYDIKDDSDRSKVIFGKYFKEKGYSFEIEYPFDPTYSGPVLQVGYVGYKDTNGYGGGYYKAEGGRGYQRHIGAVGSYGDTSAPINKDLISTFKGTELSKYSRGWKILAECASDHYCKSTLDIPKNYPGHISIPLNNYIEIERDRGYDNYHPLQLKFRKVKENYKFDAGRFKHINSARGIQR